MRKILGFAVLLAILVGIYLAGSEYVRRHPQDVPWTALDLDHPIGAFTGRKLTALADDPEQCRALLERAEVGDSAMPPRSAGPDCGYDDGMRFSAEGRELVYSPPGVVTSCPVAAAMVVFERQVVQPAALRHFGREASGIDHAGSYSCRRLYGRSEGRYSEHATANALDITGFRIEGGETARLLRDWHGDGPRAEFLREVRDGACRLFSTVLSPDYNEAHADHFHFGQARRGARGWRMCR
ncbi:MAG TPA: extensin family protein [Sphingomicrobium sp.]|nr:extensin family protein [Sphingomicrobium sp.]